MDKPEMFAFTKHEPLGVVVGDHALELAAAAAGLEARAGAGRRLHGRHQAVGVHLLLDARLRRADGGGGFPARRRQHRHRLRRRDRDRAGRAPAGRQGRLHRRRRDGRRGLRRGGEGASSTSRSSWAASRPTSSSTTPTSSDAVKGAISGIFAASGQTCIAGSRLLVQRSVYEEVAGKVVAFANSAKLGDPMQDDTQVGPITTRPAARQGAGLHRRRPLGGRALPARRRARPARRSWRRAGSSSRPSSPTSPTTCGSRGRRSSAPCCRSSRSRTRTHAVEIANDTVYGLAAGVWTGSIRRAFLMADRLQAGTVWVNTYRAVSFMAPFGGYKRSGIGRESGQDADPRVPADQDGVDEPGRGRAEPLCPALKLSARNTNNRRTSCP